MSGKLLAATKGGAIAHLPTHLQNALRFLALEANADSTLYTRGQKFWAKETGKSLRQTRKDKSVLEKLGYIVEVCPEIPQVRNATLDIHIPPIGSALPVDKEIQAELQSQKTGSPEPKERKQTSALQVNKKYKSEELCEFWSQISKSAGVSCDYHDKNLGKPLRELREVFSIEALCFWAESLKPENKFQLMEQFKELSRNRMSQENLAREFERVRNLREAPICDLSDGCDGTSTGTCKMIHNEHTRDLYLLRSEKEAISKKEGAEILRKYLLNQKH